ILAESIRIQGEDKDEDKGEMIVDTTVQPKNITFPTDDKLRKKIIHQCKKIAQEEGIKLPRTYQRELKRLSYLQRFRRTREQRQQARKADKRILTIARNLVRQLKARLDEPGQERYRERIAPFERVLAQKKHDQDKVYSLHEPHVQCIAKGKAHVAYEFGTKVSFIIGKHSGIIYGALNIEKNDYDGHTLAAALEQFKALNGYRPRRVLADLGYRGRKTVQGVEVLTPDALKRASGSQRYRLRRAMHRRSNVEATVSYLKRCHRLARNFYKGVAGDHYNVLLVAAAASFARWMRAFLAFWAHVWRCVQGMWAKRGVFVGLETALQRLQRMCLCPQARIQCL
ncbi:MAG: transposase, partial [Saprospiraceae bacterium]|nr:transposase [Saprospiraceae bacterium]